VADPLQAAEGADAIALITPWPAFRSLDPSALAARMTGRVVLDPYGLLDAATCRRTGLARYRLGVA
jgi:UDPglucose 6-dehydrogenase